MASVEKAQFFQTYLDNLAAEIRECSEKYDMPSSYSAERVIARRLGYENEDVKFVDGSGDHGIDFWFASEGGLYIYQVKTHELTEDGKINYRVPFGSDGVFDLMRVKNYLLNEQDNGNETRLENLRDTFHRLIRNHQTQEVENPLHIYLSLIILGEELTDTALQDLANLEAQSEQPHKYKETNLQFHIGLHTLKDILASEWRENNDEWKDRDGYKRETIRLTPLRQSDRHDYLNDHKSAIFYCKAVDLVNAYEDFGYQIFAPNVRANIKNSNVNSAITESASYVRSMKEFRFLNNGLTIICRNYRLPSGQRPAFEVTEPGIVNGLQTVVALHRAYRNLQEKGRQEFEENCYVLVRLLRTDAVNQISDVVLATNNQNPMQPRNLVSNSSEQTHYFLFFANNMGWFYESKQGAWDAFRKDEKSWRPRVNRSAASFRGKQGYKKLDNHDLAQDWLAFLGFAEKAANDRKHLFDKGYYELIFLSRLRNHAYGRYQSVDDALKDCDSDTPFPHTMLAAHLAHGFVDRVVPSTQVNRKEALQRRGINDRNQISTADEEKILGEDEEYILNQALGTMSLVFVEFIGLTLFRIFGSDAHRIGEFLLRNHSWGAIANNLDWQYAVDRAKNLNTNLAHDDLLIIMWLFFREAVQTLMGGAWQTAYRNTRYKPRFVLNHRNSIYQETLAMDQSIQRRVPIRIWAYGIREGEGFFGYIRRVIMETYR